jgi:hypothetical protein
VSMAADLASSVRLGEGFEFCPFQSSGNPRNSGKSYLSYFIELRVYAPEGERRFRIVGPLR